MDYQQKLALLKQLAEELGVKLDSKENMVISTLDSPAKIKDTGGLEVQVLYGDTIHVNFPRAPGISIELVNPQSSRFVSAPEGAVYEITAHLPRDGSDYSLNGEVYSVYVGKSGIILDRAGKTRVCEAVQKAMPKG